MMDDHLQRVEKDLGDATFLQYFRRFLQQTYCAENLYFWETVNKWNEEYATLSPQQRIERAQLIHSLYFAPLSENELNLDIMVKEKVDKKIADQDIDQNLFVETQFAVFALLSSDSYPKFTDSELYQHYKAGVPLPDPVKTNELPLNITAEEFENSFIFTGVAKRNYDDPQSSANRGQQSKQGGNFDKGKTSLSSGIKSYLTSWLPVPNKAGGNSSTSTTSPPGSPLPSTVPSLTTIVNPLDAKLKKLEEKKKDSKPYSTQAVSRSEKTDKKKRFKWKESQSPETSPVGSPTPGSPFSSPTTMSPQSGSPTTSPRRSLYKDNDDRNGPLPEVAALLSAKLAEEERVRSNNIEIKTPPQTTSSGETSPLASSPPSQLPVTASPKVSRASPKVSSLTQRVATLSTPPTSVTTSFEVDAKKPASESSKGGDLQENSADDVLMSSVAGVSLSHSAPEIHEITHPSLEGSSGAIANSTMAATSSASFTDTSKPMGLPASVMQNKKKKKRFAFGLKKEAD
eukprot:TRINITY_DN206_c0_g1_i3.p1 TRINITY_DN206_c0_g1~~TRINITY_DN206_c0_g1_i3.p1  ORF type:complete len:514 (+),score=130.03 TRINITY_DN206_c0_g1_i3:603-2144(+)